MSTWWRLFPSVPDDGCSPVYLVKVVPQCTWWRLFYSVPDEGCSPVYLMKVVPQCTWWRLFPSVPDESCSTNASPALSWISMLILVTIIEYVDYLKDVWMCHAIFTCEYIQSNLYKAHAMEPEYVIFMTSFLLYTGLNYMHYSLMGKMRLPFIDSDLLYRGAIYRQWFAI